MPVSLTAIAARPCVPSRTHLDPAAGRRVGERVAEEVREHLRDPVGVDVDGQRRTAVHHEVPPPSRRTAGRSRSGTRRDELAEVDDPEVELDRALLRPRELGQVGSEPLQPGRLLPDGDQHLLARLEHPVEHPFDVALDRRQRRAHLVGDLRDEPRPAPLGRLELDRQPVDVAGQLGELELARLGDPLVVVPVRQPAGRVAHLAHRAQDAAGHEDVDTIAGRAEARGQRDPERRRRASRRSTLCDSSLRLVRTR